MKLKKVSYIMYSLIGTTLILLKGSFIINVHDILFQRSAIISLKV